MLFFRRTYLGQHLQEMLADLRRIIVIGSTDEAERLEKMTEEERAAYLEAKKKRDEDIVLY